MKVQRALISVYRKDGLETFARELAGLGVEIISSGGTATFLQKHNIPVTEISEVTGFREILDGRVKTIHPRIAGGILALRDRPEHLKQLSEIESAPIDLVVVNLYPFLDALEQGSQTHRDMLELIDIGGPTLIRAAAKNHPFVGVVTAPEQYAEVVEDLKANNGGLSDPLRRKLAAEAFQHTAFYDAMIAQYFTDQQEGGSTLQSRMVLPLQLSAELRYGENPHQKAGFFQPTTRAGISGIEQLSGIALSYNNILDVDAAVQTVASFEEPTVVIMKHTNPCGVGSAESLAEAYKKAMATDPVSAFGGILSVNDVVNEELALALKGHFLEVLIAPDFTPEALGILKKKKKLRILKYVPKTENRNRWALRSALQGVLIQEWDTAIWDESQLEAVTKRQPTDEEWKALAFNWRVVKHVKSNAIVFGLADRTLGIGAGQMSRVDSVELAVKKAASAGLSLQNSVLASDAFFPFRDGVDAAAAAGATAVIQPGGSIRDEEVIAAADEHNLAMVFTRMRHFRH